ncbi:MAG TPA: DUF6069 family protein [Caldilineaceae bacterium]|nr:DUF6069 family protein [Caldilineaceae bacterium]
MTTVATSTRPTTSAIWRNGLLATAVSAVVNAVLYLVGSALGGFPSDVITPLGYPVTLVPVLVMSIVPVLLGTLAYWLLTRFTDRANRWFIILVAVVFVAMFFGPPDLRSAGAPMLMVVLLEVMHVVTAGAAIYFLTRSSSV